MSHLQNLLNEVIKCKDAKDDLAGENNVQVEPIQITYQVCGMNIEGREDAASSRHFPYEPGKWKVM